MQYFSRWQMFAIVGALGLLVVGVSLVAIPPDAPKGTQTQVAGAFVTGPSPRATQAPVGSISAPSVAPAPTGTAATSPVGVSGPAHISPWTTADYTVTFLGSGSRAAEVWWTGAAMGNWTWQRLDGHCELTPTQDKLSGTVVDRVVLQLQLTPSGAPGGRLVVYGREGGGPTYTLAVVTVG